MNVTLYGSGKIGKKWLHKLGEENVFCFLDSDESKEGQSVCGKKIISLKTLAKSEIKYPIFTATVRETEEIEKKICEAGLCDRIVYTPYDEEICRVNGKVEIDADTVFEGHNFLGTHCKLTECNIGFAAYISNKSELFQTRVGKYSAIGPGVSLIRGEHPTGKFVSVHPAFYSPQNAVSNLDYVEQTKFNEFRYTNNGYVVEIGADVWIGADVKILEGVAIGHGAIILAGALVAKDVEPYSIVGGVPARPIRYRFTKQQMDFLLELKWWDKPESWIRKYAEYFDNIDTFTSVLSERKNL